jgi:hypothetical protein
MTKVMKLEGTIMEMDHDIHIAANIRFGCPLDY